LRGISQRNPAPERLLTENSFNEDAAVVTFPPGKALVQTVDFFTPIVNDPYTYGRIAAVNAFSDVYAMGGVPWTAMHLACFPIGSLPMETLSAILQGGADVIAEAGAVPAGGHTLQDKEVKYGLSVTGAVDPAHFAANTKLRPGDSLILTKPLGTGILATAIKAQREGHARFEATISFWGTRLNNHAGALIPRLRLEAATDITGYGLGGHLLEMAVASRVAVRLYSAEIPVLPDSLELAEAGLIPGGSLANRRHAEPQTAVADSADPLRVALIFDAQTSGGLLLAVPPAKLAEASAMLADSGELAVCVGAVEQDSGGPKLHIE